MGLAAGRAVRAQLGWIDGGRREADRGSTSVGHAARRGELGRATGAGEESLEVAQAVASVAAGIDPVIAETTLIAPCPDRVRVDAKEAGRLGHGQGRVGGSDRQGRGHRSRQEM